MLISFRDLEHFRAAYPGQRIVFGGGTFDLLHRGHLEFLQGLRRRGDIVVVSVASDKNVIRRKGPARPIIKQADRLRLIEAMKYVDAALISPTNFKNNLSPSTQIMHALRPEIFVSKDPKWFNYVAKITQFGAKFVYDDQPKRESTTRIIRRVVTRHGFS